MERVKRAAPIADARLRRRVDDLLAKCLRDCASPSAEDVERVVAEIEAARMVLEAENQELRNRQQQLEQYRDRYVDLYDFAPMGYVTLDADGYVQEINLSGARMLGQQPDVMTGYPFARYLAADDQDRFLEHLRLCARSRVETTIEVSLMGDGPEPLRVQLRSVPVEDPHGQVTLCKTAMTDLSERRHMEEALRASQAFLQAIVDAIPEALTVIDRDYRIVLANRAARQLAASADPRGGVLPCHRLVRGPGPSCVASRESCLFARIVRSKKAGIVVHRHRDDEGNDVYVEVHAAPILDAAGEVLQIVELRRDVTAQKQTEEALRAAENKLCGQ